MTWTVSAQEVPVVTTPWAEYGLLGLVLCAGFFLLHRHGTEILKLLGSLGQRIAAIETLSVSRAEAMSEMKRAAEGLEQKVDAHGELLVKLGADTARALQHTTGNLRQVQDSHGDRLVDHDRRLSDHDRRISVIEAVVNIPNSTKSRKPDGRTSP